MVQVANCWCLIKKLLDALARLVSKLRPRQHDAVKEEPGEP